MAISESLREALDRQNMVIKKAEEVILSIPTSERCEIDVDGDHRLAFRKIGSKRVLCILSVSKGRDGKKVVSEPRSLFQVSILLRTKAVLKIPDFVSIAGSDFESIHKEVNDASDIVESRLCLV